MYLNPQKISNIFKYILLFSDGGELIFNSTNETIFQKRAFNQSQKSKKVREPIRNYTFEEVNNNFRIRGFEKIQNMDHRNSLEKFLLYINSNEAVKNDIYLKYLGSSQIDEVTRKSRLRFEVKIASIDFDLSTYHKLEGVYRETQATITFDSNEKGKLATSDFFILLNFNQEKLTMLYQSLLNSNEDTNQVKKRTTSSSSRKQKTKALQNTSLSDLTPYGAEGFSTEFSNQSELQSVSHSYADNYIPAILRPNETYASYAFDNIQSLSNLSLQSDDSTSLYSDRNQKSAQNIFSLPGPSKSELFDSPPYFTEITKQSESISSYSDNEESDFPSTLQQEESTSFSNPYQELSNESTLTSETDNLHQTRMTGAGANPKMSKSTIKNYRKKKLTDFFSNPNFKNSFFRVFNTDNEYLFNCTQDFAARTPVLINYDQFADALQKYHPIGLKIVFTLEDFILHNISKLFQSEFQDLTIYIELTFFIMKQTHSSIHAFFQQDNTLQQFLDTFSRQNIIVFKIGDLVIQYCGEQNFAMVENVDCKKMSYAGAEQIRKFILETGKLSSFSNFPLYFQNLIKICSDACKDLSEDATNFNLLMDILSEQNPNFQF